MTENAPKEEAMTENYDPHVLITAINVEDHLPPIPDGFTLGKRGYVEEEVDVHLKEQQEYIRGLLGSMAQIISYQNQSANTANAYRSQLAQVQPEIDKAREEAAHYKGEAERVHAEATGLQGQMNEILRQKAELEDEIKKLRGSLAEAEAAVAVARTATPAVSATPAVATTNVSTVNLGITKEDLLSLPEDAQASAIVRLASELAVRHIAEAEAEADEIKRHARTDISSVESEYKNLISLKDSTANQLHAFYTQALHLLSEIQADGEHTPPSTNKPAPVSAKETSRRQVREEEKNVMVAPEEEAPAPAKAAPVRTVEVEEAPVEVVETVEVVGELPTSTTDDLDAVLEELE